MITCNVRVQSCLLEFHRCRFAGREPQDGDGGGGGAEEEQEQTNQGGHTPHTPHPSNSSVCGGVAPTTATSGLTEAAHCSTLTQNSEKGLLGVSAFWMNE